MADGHEVFGIRLDEGPALEGVVERRVDILESRDLDSAFADFAPDKIVHLAGLSHVGRSWDQMPLYYAVNVLGVENVLASAAGVPVVFASSSEVYGLVPRAEQPIPETRQPAPRNPYALTKAVGERLVLTAGGVVVRAFNLAGPGQETTFSLPSFAAQLAAHDDDNAVGIKVGNLEAERDFVHVADGAEAFVAVLQRAQPGEIYNLGCGRAVSIRAALDRLIAISGLDVSIEVETSRQRPVDVPLLLADSSKLESLGWRPTRGLEQALVELWTASRAEKQVPESA